MIASKLKEYLDAGFAGVWVKTWEPEEVHGEVCGLLNDCQCWDFASGIRGTGQGIGDPITPIKERLKSEGVTLLMNYHRFLQNPMVVQTLCNAIHQGKSMGSHFVVLSPKVEIPLELEKLFVVIEDQLPGEEKLNSIACELFNGNSEERASSIDPAIIDAAKGLTCYEAEGAYALSIVRCGEIQPNNVWEVKTQTLEKTGILTLHKGTETFADLGGLDALKQFCKSAVAERTAVQPRGVLLLGVSGTGKSAFAKALGAESHRPVLCLDVGRCMGSLVGETETNVRCALQTADAMSPCILFIDEVEKGLAGGTSQHQGDNGVKAGMLGCLLTWMNDHTSDVFVVCTANNIESLPPEFTRAERFDAVFFLDLPGDTERTAIWQHYREVYGQSEPWPRPDDKDWTGAEIKSCCRLAALLGVTLEEAGSYVVPVSRTAGEKVTALREWATGRCIDATRGGVYHHNKTGANPERRRKVK